MLAARKHFSPSTIAPSKRPNGRRLVARAAASRSDVEPFAQLATAKIPANVNQGVFNNTMYNWAATLVQSGANYPFALSLAADKIDQGFKVSLLANKTKTELAPAGEIECTVEELPQGPTFIVRFYEGPASNMNMAGSEKAPKDPEARLDAVIEGLVDVPTLMQTMPNAIRTAVRVAAENQ